MQTKKIVNAGNVIVPAILALEDLGFEISVKETSATRTFVAVRNQESYGADDPVALLGLIKLIELRSWDWYASDSEIDKILQKYAIA